MNEASPTPSVTAIGGECLPTEEWLEEDKRRHESSSEVPEGTTNAHGDVIEKSPGY